MQNADDAELLAAAAAGDVEAFGRFYDRHAPVMYAVAMRLVRRRSDADDVLQEAFTQVWREAGRYRSDRATPRGWLAMITRSRALDHLRRERNEARRGGDAADVITTPDLAESLQEEDRGQLLRGALARLPLEQSGLIHLAFFGGLTHQQIAGRTGIPLGTVKTRIRLGMQRLRMLLDSSSKVA